MQRALRFDPAKRCDALLHWIPAVCAAQPIRLTAVARHGPEDGIHGIYVVRYQGPHERYVEERMSGHPIYIGSGVLRQRSMCHLRKLTASRDLDPWDFTIGMVETDGPELALLGEQLAINEIQPRWNTPGFRGFGSNAVGAGRSEQRMSEWTFLHGPEEGPGLLAFDGEIP